MDREKDDFVAYEKTEANYNARLERIRQVDNIDAKFGYEKVNDSRKRTAWLVNFQQSETVNTMSKKIVAAVDYYFLQPDGKRFKIAFPFKPYLYLAVVPETEFIVSSYLTRKYESVAVSFVEKEDLDLKNHLAGLKSKFLKVEFLSTVEMAAFKRDLMKQIKKNRENLKNSTDYTSLLAKNMGFRTRPQFDEPVEQIIDIREYDLPLACRASIDNKIFAGLWYDVVPMDSQVRMPTIKRNTSIVEPYEPVVCAYDIETTKLPLKFPDSSVDQIIMISYMIDGRGFLITNRQVVAADIEDLEYTPKPEFRGEFKVFNEPNERATISKFFEHLLKVKPSIMVSYNGDFFDWPFVEARSRLYGLDMNETIGFCKNRNDVYQSTCCLHLDAFAWVKRDSYLPMGSQGLKATTKAKLRYDPVELDPELMVDMAKNQPQVLANYSVSDAVCTYYLYQKYVHPFIFALCTIIPLAPDDVLRNGSGTLCEALLMTEAFSANIIYPNKQAEQGHTFTNDGKLIETETYVGARVEALESGLFRSDIPERFKLDVECLQHLKDNVSEAMRYTLVAEMGLSMDSIVDFDEVCEQVQEKIDVLIQNAHRHENPKIYHLDVSAMYPNIILTNRLQPSAMVTDEQCLACVYNTSDAKCKREMEWTWRGDLIPASKGEFERIKHRLEEEKHGKPPKPFNQLSKEDQRKLEKQRIRDYCKVAYGKAHVTREEKKTSRVCQRENPFYINTVLAFRDRRYEYKEMLKKSKQALSAIDSTDLAGIKNANTRVVLYESLQLAHKCILNSFYGYVFRKGSRWFSMSMAGIICQTGSMIISDAHELIGKIGRSLELDTDGIWCLLPSAFPENFAFQTKEGKKVTVSYPGAMLNLLVKDRFTNDQYHYEKEDGSIGIRSENSIFFEVDGPYKAMILPASKEAGKKLKKRYAVFNADGSLAELKGFELKRRGELGIIKQFQSEVFKDFLKGSNLVEAYQNVAKEANYWIDILATKGHSLPDDELFGLIAENRSMSKKLSEYGSQKSTSITTAKRLAEFLGDEMTKNAGLATTFIVSKEPIGAPVTERTIPVAIFQADIKIRVHFLRKWTKSQSVTVSTDVRDLIDWKYYEERLYSCIQKIITLPAALQGIENPVPRVKHPDWLEAEKRKKLDLTLQPRINEFFKKKDPAPKPTNTPKSANRSTQNHSQLLAITGLTPKRSRPDKAADLPLQKKTFAKDGFKAWLIYLKASICIISKWEKQRAEHRKNLALKQSDIAMPQRNMTTMQKLMMENVERVRSHAWYLIQISETSIPGVYDTFAVSDGVMRRFELIVPRTFYVNDNFERSTTHGKRVENKILPRLRPYSYLYQYSINEQKYVKQLSAFNEQLCKMNINGIYETQMPLQFRAITKLGAISNVKTLTNATRINADQMERIPCTEMSFLPINSFQVVYFYEITVNNRSAFGLFNPTASQGNIWIINSSQLDPVNVNTIFKKEYAKHIEKYGEGRLFDGTERMNVNFSQAKLIKDGSKQMHQVIKAFKFSQMDPILFVVQSSKPDATLKKEFPMLANYPFVRVNGAADSPNILTGLDWWSNISKLIIQHFLNSYIVLTDYWKIAEYTGIPIGNIPEDMATFALDCLYARALEQQNFVLWASPSDRPDFGGKELDTLQLETDWEAVSFQKCLSHVYDEEMFEPRSICVEMDLGVLAITAIMQSAAIAEAEGVSEYIGFATEQTNMTIEGVSHAMKKVSMADFNEALSISGALRVLRTLCASLIRDIKPGESNVSDQLIIALYRWIRSPKSLLYDPAIEQAVFTLMRKLCLLLVTELNQLGARVTHCSFSKIVLCTGRSDLNAAMAFVDTLRMTLRQKKLFASLNLVPTRYDRLMLWLNFSNHAYITCYDPLNNILTADNNKAHVELQLAQVLLTTGDCRRVFYNIVMYYLNLLSKQAREDMNDDEFTQFAGEKFREVIAPRIFEIINKLKENHAQLRKVIENEKLPVLKAYGLTKKHLNVPLEFIKCCFKIFETYTPIQEAVADIRYQALLLVDKDEFSTEAVWKPPKVNVILEQLFCPHCTYNIDLDVCAQKHPEDEADEPFVCPSCSHPLSKLLIEELLMERTKKMQISYQLQDFRCSKCKQIGNRLLRTNCQFCYGSYENTIPAEEYRANLETLGEIADVYMLENLAFVVQEQQQVLKD